jgi:thiosulfate dehydrogenase
MLRPTTIVAATIAARAAVIGVTPYASIGPHADETASSPTHPVPRAKNGGVVVMLCDGKTSIEVKDLKAGHQMSREQALAVTRELMAKWQREHPAEKWELAQESGPSGQIGAPAPVPSAKAPSNASGANASGESPVPSEGKQAPPAGKQQGDTYASFTDRDYKIWKTETDKFVAEGKRIFHDAKELGGTIGVSCDMCHPDASNTHAETYPKYQVQLQRVALLRDMIDWCIENPVKGKALEPNDPKLRALEAYIIAQRRGVALDYGKH